MDLPVNKIHRILLDAGLPSTIEDLKNPTEDYIVNLLTTFMLQFSINMSLIDQPFSEQYTIMTYFEDSDIINLINLHAALIQIFDKIFINDFCITDITSPGQKRLRRQAKFLANFILYAVQKKLNFNNRLDEIQDRFKLLEELKDKKIQILESINDKALHKGMQLSLKKKIENDMQHIHLKLQKLNKRELELEIMKNDAEKENQRAKELCGSIKIAAGKLSKVLAELQSEIVHSPEEYRSRLNELEEQKNFKVEERDIMQEGIQDKKQSIKQIEMKLNFVRKVNDELSTLKTIHEQLKNKKVQSDNIKMQINSLNNRWDELQNKLAMHKDQIDTEMNELQSHREKDIAPLYKLHNQLLNEKKLKKAELEVNKICFNEKYLAKNKLLEDIKKEEKTTTVFLSNCQEIYDNEVAYNSKNRRRRKNILKPSTKLYSLFYIYEN